MPGSKSISGNVLLQTTMAQYRDLFVERLLEEAPDFSIWAGADYFERSTVLSEYISKRSSRLTNRFFWKRRLLWQSGAWTACHRTASAVLELNPRILSNWPILVHRRLTGRSTAVWGHAWPRGRRSRHSLLLRDGMARLAGAAIVYTHQDRQDLVKRINLPVFVAPNAVVSEKVRRPTATPRHVIQVGRLVTAKRPALTLEAWAAAVQHLPPDVKLIFVGDGPERASLEADSKRLGVASRVEFTGNVSDRVELASIYAQASVSVCAGYAGLSLTESLSYGVPMIIADDEPHSPEIALAKPHNSFYFAARSPASLASSIIVAWTASCTSPEARQSIAAETLAQFSIESMVRGFLAAAGRG